MSIAILFLASHLAVLVGGGYLSYKYGRRVEAKVQAALAIANRIRANV